MFRVPRRLCGDKKGLSVSVRMRSNGAYFTKSERQILEEKVETTFSQLYPKLSEDGYKLRITMLKPNPDVGFDDSEVTEEKKVDGLSEFSKISVREDIKDKISKVVCEDRCKEVKNCKCIVNWSILKTLVSVEEN